MYGRRLLFLRCCGCWCCQRKLWCLLRLLVLLPIVLVVACLVTAMPVGIIAVVWVIPLCRVVILLLVRCVRQVVDCCSTVFGQVTWLATFVAYCYWILSFSLIVGSFVLSLSFPCSFHWLPYLLSFHFSFCLAVALVVAISFSFSFSFLSFALSLSFVSFVSFASSSFSFVCC